MCQISSIVDELYLVMKSEMQKVVDFLKSICWSSAFVLDQRLRTRYGSFVSFRLEVNVLLVREPCFRRLSCSGTLESLPESLSVSRFHLIPNMIRILSTVSSQRSS